MAGAITERAEGTSFSMGKPGVGRRSFDRMVGFSGLEPVSASKYMDMAQAAHHKGVREIGRGVRTMAKGLVEPGAERSLLNGMGVSIPGRVEAILPVQTPSGERMFVYSAWNGPDRGGAVDASALRARVDDVAAEVTPRSASEYVAPVARKFTLVDYIPQGMEPSLQRIWGPAFGWTLDDIKAYQRQLNEEAERPPEQRLSPFVGVVVPGEKGKPAFARGAMVEGMITPQGYFGEKSEWAGDKNIIVKDGGKAAIAAADALVIGAMRSHVPVTLMAEVNTASEPDRHPPAIIAALATGMEVPVVVLPDGRILENILEHNVGVGDTHPLQSHEIELPEGDNIMPVRSFQVMHLPPTSMDTLYTSNDVDLVRDVLREGERRLTDAGYPRTRTRRT